VTFLVLLRGRSEGGTGISAKSPPLLAEAVSLAIARERRLAETGGSDPSLSPDPDHRATARREMSRKQACSGGGPGSEARAARRQDAARAVFAPLCAVPRFLPR